MNVFTEIVKGFQWLGHTIAEAEQWIPRIIAITEDASADAEKLLPQATQVLVDVDNLALAAVADGGEALTAASTLTAAIITAAENNALNIADDEAVVSAFKAFIVDVTTKKTWSNVISAQQKLVTDWNSFGEAAEAALQKLEEDASGS